MANKDNTYTVDNFVIELDTDDKEADDREYIEYITATIMTICNDFIKRHLQINTVDGSYVMWVPSICDVLAEDWYFVK